MMWLHLDGYTATYEMQFRLRAGNSWERTCRGRRVISWTSRCWKGVSSTMRPLAESLVAVKQPEVTAEITS